jgi:hypothetical protein
MDQTTEKTNLLAQLAKRKAEAQKGGHAPQKSSKYQSNQSRYLQKAQPFAPRGGRNGQGKP